MHIVENNKIQNALLIFIEVDSLIQDRKLEKDYEEFCSLAHRKIEILKFF